MRNRITPALLLACAVGAAPLWAQSPGSSCSVDQAVAAAAAAVEAVYVLPGPARLAAAALRDSLRAAAYADVGDVATLAERLTRELRALTGDGHMLVEALPAAGGAAGDDWIAKWRARAPSDNYGIARVEVLPGNVGYLALRSFHTFADAAPTLSAAIVLVRHTDALILDLRHNGGGDSDTERALTHTFLAPDATLPLRTETRQGPDPAPPIPALPWPRYGPDRPLVVLLNGRSFSAPEALAYALQTAGRARVVGTTSAGGAHMTDEATPLPCALQGWIPNRRPLSPVTGANWEGRGVQPDIAATDAEAIDTAHRLLLRSILEASSDPDVRERATKALQRLEATL